MKLTLQKDVSAVKTSDTLILFMPEGENSSFAALIPTELSGALEYIDTSCITGKEGESVFLPFSTIPNILVIGIGKEKEIDLEVLRNCASGILASSRKYKISEICVLPPKVGEFSETSIIQALCEGIYLKNYSFNKYKTDKKILDVLLKKVSVVSQTRDSKVIVQNVSTICDNVLLCRDLVNETSENSNPVLVAKLARQVANNRTITCTVLGKKDLEKLKMGLILAVSKGSPVPPQLVIMKYTGNPKSKDFTALVGKGITFDSGGLNLKSSGNIETMRMDMAGAATVLYTIKTVAELKLKTNLYAVLPLAENMLSGGSYRPGDIFTSFSGKTVQIGNTDAEGRLILADAVSYCEKKLKPKYIIDIATLTGACLVTFGELVAAALTNSNTLREKICNASKVSGEKTWELPVFKEFEAKLKSDIADLNNIPADRKAGTIIGAAFIKQFVDKSEWLHLDIAGTAWSSEDRGYVTKGATGYGIRLLLELLMKL